MEKTKKKFLIHKISEVSSYFVLLKCKNKITEKFNQSVCQQRDESVQIRVYWTHFLQNIFR